MERNPAALHETDVLVHTDIATGRVILHIEHTEVHLNAASARSLGAALFRCGVHLMTLSQPAKPAAIDAPAASEKVM